MSPPPIPLLAHRYPNPTPTSPSRQSTAYEHVVTFIPSSSQPSPSSSTTLQPNPTPSPNPTPPKNALIFIPGLGDGPTEVPYVRHLALSLSLSLSLSPGLSSSNERFEHGDGNGNGNENGNGNYSVFEINLTSAYGGFGFGSLRQDARDVAALVRYVRKEQKRERVVLMGHSTGCQGVMEFVSFLDSSSSGGGDDLRIDGAILQGPVSDREAIALAVRKAEEGRGGEGEKKLRESVRIAEELVRLGKGDEIMRPEVLPLEEWRVTPVSAYRWFSLAGEGGDDDYFSSDLPDEKLSTFWGKFRQPVLILPSGADEHVPDSIDVGEMVERWKGFCRPGLASSLSGLIPGAGHRVSETAGQEWLADRVGRFLVGLESHSRTA